MNENNKVFELSEEELAKVGGGYMEGGSSAPDNPSNTDSKANPCPNSYILCTTACLNANCGHLAEGYGIYSCGKGLNGIFSK